MTKEEFIESEIKTYKMCVKYNEDVMKTYKELIELEDNDKKLLEYNLALIDATEMHIRYLNFLDVFYTARDLKS